MTKIPAPRKLRTAPPGPKNCAFRQSGSNSLDETAVQNCANYDGGGSRKMEILVADAIMGSGKTSAAINYMEDNYERFRFLFVTPYLEETGRIQMACPNCQFKKPAKYGTKSNGLKHLLRRGENIAATHELFLRLDDEGIQIIREQQYVLIIDEEMQVVEQFHITRQDIGIMVDMGLMLLRDDGTIAWTEDGWYSGYYGKVKKAAQESNLIWVKDEDGACAGLYRAVSTKFFDAFRKVVVLTYLFEGTVMKAYFELYGYSVRSIGVRKNLNRYEFFDGTTEANLENLASKITIWIDPACSVGRRKGSLSYKWYSGKKKDDKMIVGLKKSMMRFMRSETGRRPHSSEILWTTYNGSRAKLTGPGYAKGFESHNCKATNKHRGRNKIAYMVNKFLNPGLNLFFLSHGIEVDQERYALASMLQFIWRSAIRDGNQITLYIPSDRMRWIFEEWLVEVSGISGRSNLNIICGIGDRREKIIPIDADKLK